MIFVFNSDEIKYEKGFNISAGIKNILKDKTCSMYDIICKDKNYDDLKAFLKTINMESEM